MNPIRRMWRAVLAPGKALLGFEPDDVRSIRNDVTAGLLLVAVVGIVGLAVTAVLSLTGGDAPDPDSVGPAAASITSDSVEQEATDTGGAGGGTILEEKRLGDTARAELAALDVLRFRAPVRESSGWLILDVLCDQADMALLTPIVIEAVTEIGTIWNSTPIDDCGNDAIFGEVSARTYEFDIRLADGVERGAIAFRAEVVKSPNEIRHLDRAVLPQLPEQFDVTIDRTVLPGTVHAYPLPIDVSTVLAISPQCPLGQPIVARIVDRSATEVFRQRFGTDDCNVDRLTPALSALDRYELQIFGEDGEATVDYRLNTLSAD